MPAKYSVNEMLGERTRSSGYLERRSKSHQFVSRAVLISHIFTISLFKVSSLGIEAGCQVEYIHSAARGLKRQVRNAVIVILLELSTKKYCSLESIYCIVSSKVRRPRNMPSWVTIHGLGHSQTQGLSTHKAIKNPRMGSAQVLRLRGSTQAVS
jgi:hypothetical protein